MVENPTFDSQTKETLVSKPSQFGSKCHLSEKFLKEFVAQSKIADYLLEWAKYKQKVQKDEEKEKQKEKEKEKQKEKL